MGCLTGRAVVVTGAGRGLGAAYARLAALEGASVVVNDIDAENAERTAHQIEGAIADSSDISTWSGADALIQRCVTEFGAIDGLVNNAGIIRVGAPHDATEDDVRRVIGVNLLGTAFCGVHALRHMTQRGSGSIVNVTSGAQLGMASVAAYAASKGGVTSLTYSWAAATEGTGVRVNAVSPDAATPLAAMVAQHFPDVPAGAKSVASNAPAVVYLLSDAAAAVSGEVILTGGDRMSRLVKAHPFRPAATSADWTVASVAQAFEEWDRT